MKEVINGLLYDTDAATRIFSAESEPDTARVFQWSATLYRTESGNYFAAGSGGALSMFSKPSSAGAVGTESILPLSEDDAYEAAEIYLPLEDLAKYFPSRVRPA
ncbi:MAG: hypothetical protein GJ676_17250 [Rhodobacteraceae bacterium]|nr:hypothetical protein [Paracoccaceae bacterium]